MRSPPADSLQGALTNSCNKYAHDDDCDLDGSTDAPDMEPWEKRQEEREHLEELLAEMDRQEEAARDAEASGDPTHYNEEAARDRWSALSREGDPQTREDIEKRLAELDAEDAAEDAAVENSCNANYHDPANHTGSNIRKQKGSRSTKGNPKAKTQQSNVPTKLPPNATDGQLERQIAKGLDAVDSGKGNQTVSRGNEKFNFTRDRSGHRANHRKEGVTNEQIAKTLTQGNFEKDETDAVAYRKNNKVIKKGSRKKGSDITTSHMEKTYDLHKYKKKPGQEPSSTGR